MPHEKQWQLWKQANRLRSNEQGELHQPLQRWHQRPQRQRRAWPVYGWRPAGLAMSIVYKILHCKKTRIQKNTWDSGWAFRGMTPSTINSQHTPEPVTIATMPHDATPLDIIHGATTAAQRTYVYNRIARIASKPRIIPIFPPVSLKNQDFMAYIRQLEPCWETELLQHIQLTHDIFTTYSKMRIKFHAVGDRSVQHSSQGAFGWIVSTTSSERLVKAYGPVRGHKPTSYWAEGYGMLVILRFTSRIQQYCMIAKHTWKWTLSSDNKSLVNTVNEVKDTVFRRNKTP